MDHYAGIDVSLESSSLCVVSLRGTLRGFGLKVGKIAAKTPSLAMIRPWPTCSSR
jgi:hypothetical protein